MPRTSKLRFNKDILKGIPRACCRFLNSEASVPVVFVVVLGFAALGIRGCMRKEGAAEDLKEQKRAVAQAAYATKFSIIDDTEAARRVEIMGLDYALTASHQVTHIQGDNKYIIDFNTKAITVDGPDQADAVVSFSEFPDLVDAAKNAGLQISSRFNAALQENLSDEDTAWLEGGGAIQRGAQDEIKKARKDTEIFSSCYGMPEKAQPNAQAPEVR